MRKAFTDDPYLHDVFTVKQMGEHTVRISYVSVMREAGWEFNDDYKPKGSVNDEKLSNNLARAKTVVREYALCNPWNWWCTFTINAEKCDRYNLDVFYKSFSRFINDYNKRRADEYRVKYLLVPERHKDGAWHMHGFIHGIDPKDLYKNEYGYMTWKQYNNKFGYISMDTIQDIDKSASYILKYMTKDKDKNVTEVNKHLYYCSKGLERATELYRGGGVYFGTWDWQHPDGYCKVKNLDVRKDDISNYLKVFDNDYTTSF